MDEQNNLDEMNWKLKWLMDEPEITAETKCYFCKKRQDQVERLIAGVGNICICNECVALYQEHIRRKFGSPTPSKKTSRICSSCEIIVPVSHRYCYNCGAQLTQEADF
jgi:formate-dependent nitrite reductase cytochrome c552 subunit